MKVTLLINMSHGRFDILYDDYLKIRYLLCFITKPRRKSFLFCKYVFKV